LDTENFVGKWFTNDKKKKVQIHTNKAHTSTSDKKHVCPVCRQSFKEIHELNLHVERTNATLKLDELPKHSEKIRSIFGKNRKKLPSNLPHVLDAQNIESSNRLLDTQNIESSKTQCGSEVQIHTNKAHTSTSDKKHVCPVCRQSFKGIHELNLHVERTNATLKCNELTKHSEKIQSNIGKNTKKLPSILPHVLDVQNIESANRLLDTQNIEKSNDRDDDTQSDFDTQNIEQSKTQGSPESSHYVEITDEFRRSIETRHVRQKVKKLTSNVRKLTSNSPHLLPTRNIKRYVDRLSSESSKCKELLDEASKCAETVYLQYSCPICNKWFLHEKRLKLHLLEHSSDDILECPACSEKFTETKDFRNHIDLHRLFKLCVLCKERFSEKCKLMDHMHMQHKVQSPGTMDLVDPKTGQRVCKCCGEKFFETELLLAHTMLFDETNVVCHVCGKTVVNKFRLKIHLTMSACNGKKIDCPDCERKFLSTTALQYHSRVHTGVLPPKTFICTRCGKAFERESYLMLHMATHNGDRPFLCTVCSKSFTRNAKLRDHMLSHTDVRPHVCQVCPDARLRFKSRCSLMKHMKRMHSERPLHVCEVCGKEFRYPYNLKVHMRAHSGELPYKCTECGEAFLHRGTWKNHVKSHSK